VAAIVPHVRRECGGDADRLKREAPALFKRTLLAKHLKV